MYHQILHQLQENHIPAFWDHANVVQYDVKRSLFHLCTACSY